MFIRCLRHEQSPSPPREIFINADQIVLLEVEDHSEFAVVAVHLQGRGIIYVRSTLDELAAQLHPLQSVTVPDRRLVEDLARELDYLQRSRERIRDTQDRLSVLQAIAEENTRRAQLETTGFAITAPPPSLPPAPVSSDVVAVAHAQAMDIARRIQFGAPLPQPQPRTRRVTLDSPVDG